MKRVISFMMLLLLMTAVLCGCKGGTDEGKTENKSEEASVYYGGTITVGITQDLDSLDPHKAVAAGTKEVLYNVFEGLVKADTDGNLVPAVAADYEISPDGMKYTFELRENVKFHNGAAVTAEDVIYSLKRCAGMLETKDPEVQVVAALSVISEINKTDKGVEVVLSEPDTELIGYFTCSIIPENYSEQASKPVGTGPFRFVLYAPLQKLVLEKNEDYYLEGVPYLDGVTFKISASAEAAFLELMAGSIDLFPYLTAEQAAQIENKYTILDGTMNLVQAMFLNNAVEPFNNPKVRAAVCHAVDRQSILNIVSDGKGSIIGSNMFPSFTKYYDSSLENYYEYNPEKAKELLSEAGYPDGISFTISVPSNYSFHVSTAQVVVEQLKSAGINAEIKLVEWATWLSEIYKGRQFEATIVGLDSQLAPGDVLRFYPSTSGKNFVNYVNSEFDSLYESAKKTVDEEKKAEYYKELQKLLAQDAASVYIQSPVQLVAVSPQISGYKFYPVYVQDMSSIYYQYSGEGLEEAQ